MPAPIPSVSVLRLTCLAGLCACLTACASSSSETGVQHFQDPGALGPYSSAVQVGELVLLSGKIGERGQGFDHEVETCIDRVDAALALAGLELRDVVEARVYLTDMGNYAQFNEIYGGRFAKPYPARTCVAVAALPGAAQVEIQVAARRRPPSR